VTLKEAGRMSEAFEAIQDALRHDSSRPESLDVLGIA
jgi:hypothetical protein